MTESAQVPSSYEDETKHSNHHVLSSIDSNLKLPKSRFNAFVSISSTGCDKNLDHKTVDLLPATNPSLQSPKATVTIEDQ